MAKDFEGTSVELALNENDTSRVTLRTLYDLMLNAEQKIDLYYSDEAVRRRKIDSGQIVEGEGRYWFKELRWSDQAWDALHGGRK